MSVNFSGFTNSTWAAPASALADRPAIANARPNRSAILDIPVRPACIRNGSVGPEPRSGTPVLNPRPEPPVLNPDRRRGRLPAAGRPSIPEPHLRVLVRISSLALIRADHEPAITHGYGRDS